MPAISKIRLTNVVYEDGDKRFNDDVFLFEGHNGAILLKNGGGKTVFIHTILQAVLPHTDLGERKIKETLKLDQAPAHVAIEWILNDKPRRYLVTAASLFLDNNILKSYRYCFEYEHDHPDRIEEIPFAIETNTYKRPAYKEEISEYYSRMKEKTHHANTFDTIKAFHSYIEEHHHIIHNEWESIVKINRDEGGIEKFFENCRTTTDLYDRLLIPIVEDSIEGHDKHTFADTFEKQRTAFQEYRNLQKSMKEHQAIQDELESYVHEFKRYSDKQEAYTLAKQHAKGLMETIIDERLAMEKEHEDNEQNWQTWENENELYNVKKASFEILKDEKKLSGLEAEYLKQLNIYEAAKERLDENKQLYYSLMYAKAKKEVDKHTQFRDQHKHDIDQHEVESDIDEIEDQLTDENKKLHGYFLTKIETLEKQIDQTKIELRPLEDTINRFNADINKEKNNQAKTTEQFNRVSALIESKEEQLKRLKQVLANPEQEDMKTEYDKWIVRRQWLDEEIIRLHHNMKDLERQLDDMTNGQQQLLTSVHEKNIKLNEKRHDEQYMNEAHEQLLIKLAEIRPNWKAIDDLHLQESRVKGTLSNLRDKLVREREEILNKERLARRFVDDYGEQDIFISDAFLAKRLESWQNQFYVVSGTEYYSNLSEADRTAYGNYSLWPLTLVTTALDKEKLLSNLEQIAERLQYPISVLTSEQIKQVADGDVKGRWIAPNHWKTNLDPNQFDIWKKNLNQAADEATDERQQKELELEELTAIIRQFEDFFITYPRVLKEQLREEILQIEAEIKTNERELSECVKNIQVLQNEIKLAGEQVGTYKEELHGLEGNIAKAIEYFQIEGELTRLEVESVNLKEQIEELDKYIGRLSHEIGRYEEEKATLDELINEYKVDLGIVKGDSLYKEVREERPIYTNEDNEVILKRREDLRYQIRGIQQAYGELVLKYEQAQENIARERKIMEDILRDHESIDMEITFPHDGVRLSNRARQAMNQGQAEVEALVKKTDKANEQFIRQDEQVKRALQDFETTFVDYEVYKFDMTIDEIESHLTDQQDKLHERKSFLQSEKERINKQLDDIKNAEHQLEKYSIAHYFKSTILTSTKLTEIERSEYIYARMAFTKDTIKKLEDTKEQLEKGKERIERAKGKFRSFINREITVPKLREMAREGLELKNTYDEIVSHQANMLKTLESADRYARDFISRNDKIVQAFINNIHNHLLNVTEQLQVIPKHTRVKIGDQWKEIYRFNIPEWTEEEGKTRINDYMDWVLEQLESERFKDNQGLEDTGKMRKEIETWLDTKQLLQVVMEHKAMKVSCRKVTNDNKVTNRLTTWEQSNKWSGGEKWSKNMTLFLGILNFVAEKKQHINKNMKRHRAVILDNPFGKASSDHVLSPVFFIAEQLGFQIIALTAHADGKFLQDYFPIIYSLRLRTASDGRKQVMGKEKSLQHAYFQDHDPVVIERLEEREQLELF